MVAGSQKSRPELHRLEASDNRGLIESLILPERLIPDRRGYIPSRSSGVPKQFLTVVSSVFPARSLYSRIDGLAWDFKVVSAGSWEQLLAAPPRLPQAAGPTAPRALLRRMLAAGIDENFKQEPGDAVASAAPSVQPSGPQGKPSLVASTLTDLAFLLDRKELLDVDACSSMTPNRWSLLVNAFRFVPFFTRKVWLGNGGAPRTGRGTGKRTLGALFDMYLPAHEKSRRQSPCSKIACRWP